MASLPKTGTVTYEEWLRMSIVRNGREEVVDGEIRITPPNKSGVPAVGVLKPKPFPAVEIDIATIWPD